MSDDEDRLRAIMAALERGAQPVVTPADAAGIAEDLILAVEHAVDRRADAIRGKGATLACPRGTRRPARRTSCRSCHQG